MGFVDTNPAALRALRQTIAAVWPEVLLPSEGYEHAGGILEQTQIKREAYESLGYPRAQIELPPAAVWAHSPMTMVVYEQPALVYYVGTTESGDSVPFRSKVKLLQDRLLDPVFGLVDGATATVFTVLPATFQTHVYDRDMLNELLLVRNQYAQGGALQFSFLIGDDASDA